MKNQGFAGAQREAAARPAAVPALALLGSGQGSTIDFLCEKIQSGSLPARAAGLITDNPKARLLDIAKKRGLPCFIIPYNKADPDKWDRELCQALASLQPRMILLAGFLKKIGPRVLERFPGRIINAHPALIPKFSGAGMYGRRVHQAVIGAGETETGASIHLVNEGYDEGQVLAQAKIPVLPGETAASLEARVKKAEKEIYFQTVRKILLRGICGSSDKKP